MKKLNQKVKSKFQVEKQDENHLSSSEDSVGVYGIINNKHKLQKKSYPHFKSQDFGALALETTVVNELENEKIKKLKNSVCDLGYDSFFLKNKKTVKAGNDLLFGGTTMSADEQTVTEFENSLQNEPSN